MYCCSWLCIFNRLAGHPENVCRKTGSKPLIIARNSYSRPSVQELLLAVSEANAMGFLVARNPFERLVSAYRDKILKSYWIDVAKEILAKYRKVIVPRYRVGRVAPTFKEFVTYVLDEFHAGNELDGHWAPVYNFCNPGQVTLTHIIKFETFDRDSHAILQKANLSHLVPQDKKFMKTNENASRGNQNSTLLVDSYLTELTPDLLDGIRELYSIDFDLFGYDKKENFQYV